MVRYCSVPQCGTYCTEPGISFHHYPSDLEHRREWLVRLRNAKAPSKYAMVCSKHFDDDAFKRSLTKRDGLVRKRLKPDALPTLNLPRRRNDRRTLPCKPPAKRAPISRQSQRLEEVAEDVVGVRLRRCPCGQVVNTNSASEAPGWVERREVSIQCNLQEMAPSPLPLQICRSSVDDEDGQVRRASQGLSLFGKGTDDGAGKAAKSLRLFQCHLCQFSCPKRYRLMYHLQSHTLVKPYSCEVCPAAFKTLQRYEAHMCKHTGEQAYQCDLCPYTTAFKGTLWEHKRSHSNALPFACSMCAYRAKRKASIRKHEQRHAGSEPFKCEVCSLGFGLKYNLEIHMQQHLES